MGENLIGETQEGLTTPEKYSLGQPTLAPSRNANGAF